LVSLLAPGLICWVLLCFAPPARSEQPNFRDPHAGLPDFIQQIEPIQPRLVAAKQSRFHAQGSYHGDDYAALSDFVQQIESERPATTDQPAQNYTRIDDDAYSALRDFVQQVATDEPRPAQTDRIRLAAAEQPKAARPAKSKAVKTPQNPEDAHVVGSQACLTCHASQAAAFAQTLMGKIGKVRKGTMECENCHGPVSAHVAAGGGRGVGGMITFRADDPTRTIEENNAICLGCHERGDRTLWRGSTHELQNVACTNCHTVMRNVTPKFQLAKLTEIDTCAQCHKNKRAEIWRTSHMPVREGKMRCSTCHNPHGSFSEALLKDATANDTCYKCHAEKRGPFLWEHPPVRESCTNCHDPHGSINDFMLKVSRPRLCQQCHANLTGHPGNPRNPASIYALNRECQNCHSQHHGSNSPAGSRFIR
jgi:DmsE family decaheme c-type cytochrome